VLKDMKFWGDNLIHQKNDKNGRQQVKNWRQIFFSSGNVFTAFTFRKTADQSRVARWYTIFKPKSHFGKFLEGLVMDNVGIFMAIWSI
jgi:hypothetical protein